MMQSTIHYSCVINSSLDSFIPHALTSYSRKPSFLVQDLQNVMQDIASLARKILARFGYFLHDGFYWVKP